MSYHVALVSVGQMAQSHLRTWETLWDRAEVMTMVDIDPGEALRVTDEWRR